MDYYVKLNTNFNSLKDIKKSYYKLSKIYHPDKNNGNNNEFILINDTYLFLINNINSSNNINYNNNINYSYYDILQEIILKYNLIYFNKIIYTLYSNKQEYINDINNLNIKNLKKKIKKLFILDIYKKINVKLQDLYFNNDVYLLINRRINLEYFKYQIKLNLDIYDNVIEFENVGDKFLEKNGKLILTVNISKPSNYFILDNYNLLIITDDIDILLFNKIPIKDLNLIEKKKNNYFTLYYLENYGLFNKKNNIYGSLYIKLNYGK